MSVMQDTMGGGDQRRFRLGELLDLAQATHGWSRRRLARALDRDASKLIPTSGVPKLDLIVRLANALSWTLRDVVDHLWKPVPRAGSAHQSEGRSFDVLNAAAREAHRRGRYADLVDHARLAFIAATNPRERARACNREAGGWDGLGCHSDALAAARQGLREPGAPTGVRRMLQANLAKAFYGLGLLEEARCVSRDLIRACEHAPTEQLPDQIAHAFAHYVAGHAHHRQIVLDPKRARAHARSAAADLRRAIALCETLADDRADISYSGIANTCRGALYEVEVVRGTCRPSTALRRLADGLDVVVNCSGLESGDWLESFGWWCIFGCNVARRCDRDDRDAQHYTAIFTNKADEIAEHLDNWALRERVVSIEYERWLASDQEGDESCVLDAEDVRKILGTIGRFPAFRPAGWKLLESAGMAYED